VNSTRRELGIIRLCGKDMTALRRQRFELDGHRCVDCGIWLTWETMQLAHVRTKRNNGDTVENTRSKCAMCHMYEHNAGGKPVPRKP
jgi:hypothetical protein